MIVLAAAAVAAAAGGRLGLDTEPLSAVDADRRTPAFDALEGGNLPFPTLLTRVSRSACAPKETRRANGELGAALGDVPSVSSVTASSELGAFDPHELDRLPWRKARLPKADVWVGEPDSPRVVMDSRRW